MRSATLPAPGASAALEVNISAGLASVEVMHHGPIMRNHDQGNSIDP